MTSPNPQSENPKTITWSSRFAYIMATTGAAVGLGNIWMFPYVAGKHGGGAFVGLYLLLVLTLGIPAMIAETVLGFLGRKSAVGSLQALAKTYRKSAAWQALGWWGALGLVLVLAFYSVVAGWTVAYAIKALSGEFLEVGPIQVQRIWLHFLANPWEMLFWHSFFMFITLWVVARGLHGGIERASKIMMPALFLILLALMAYGLFAGEWRQAWQFLFHLDVHKLSSMVVAEVLGLAFFTLAIGAGCLMVYGAYLPKTKTGIVSSLVWVALLDVIVALVASMAIFSLVTSA